MDDFTPDLIWTIYWLDAQGYDVFNNIVYQGNKSSILLENNGNSSSSKRKKHTNIRYYFITDRIEKDELYLEWCTTADMIVDFMKKPNQGAAFKRFQDKLTGFTEAQDLAPGKPRKYCEDKISTHGQKGARNAASVDK